MAELEFIVQAVTMATHAKAIGTLLRLRAPARILVSVAFVKEVGVQAIANAMKKFSRKTTFYVGIRNEITSIQAIKRLLKLGITVYAVDTGARRPIFHPKLYYISSDREARVIIGSANLTSGGLYNNIEISTGINLDLSNEGDANFGDEIFRVFAEMRKSYPQHVFRIKNAQHAKKLYESGRLVDERIESVPTVLSSTRPGMRDRLPRMSLLTTHREPIARPTGSTPFARPPKNAVTSAGYLAWQSKALTRRDLSIPNRGGTNPTGSMGLKKGAFAAIDQRHYFRSKVFAGLNWKRTPHYSKWERSHADFELVIKNVNFGVFNLMLSHNTNKKSRTYKQKNFMTQLHWGSARKYVAKPDLLGRVFRLFRKGMRPPAFLIEID